MKDSLDFDVIIIGGSNAGLSAALALGRALKKVLIVDSGLPCNRQTPHAQNFITHDGRKPSEIKEMAKNEVLTYTTVQFLDDSVNHITGINGNFEVKLARRGENFKAKKLLFSTGIKDIMPDLPGFAECWGISIIHCPFCHGYEYQGRETGILMNNDLTADFSKFIQNWTTKLTLFTNGRSKLTLEHQQSILDIGIQIIETDIQDFEHTDGYLKCIRFTDGTTHLLDALYARTPFEQHCPIPQVLGCQMTEQGYIKVDEHFRTTIAGIYAAGDNINPMRSLATAVGAGNFAGAMMAHELIRERTSIMPVSSERKKH